MSAEKLLQHPAALCNMVRRVALAAGKITLSHFDESGYPDPQEKPDGSFVTKADIASEQFILAELEKLTPGIPTVSEEAVSRGDAPDISSAPYFWMVDPLDATREFIAGSENFTINIALIHSGVPVIGVIYAPVLDELYAGCGPGTALRWFSDTGRDKIISMRPMPEEGVMVVASRVHSQDSRTDRYLESFKVQSVRKMGSALKFCLLAFGKADLYPRLGPSHEWDTAAGDAILRSAGGRIVDMQGQPLSYGNVARGFLNPEFVAAREDVIAAIFASEDA